MKTYHIVFKNSSVDFMSVGKNFIARTPVMAIIMFETTYPDSLFIAMYDLNALAEIKGGGIELQKELEDKIPEV